ncbi:plasmid pRiA4b ORF-3 family protein [Mesobacillus jeotgali]|uniref:Plasmid pRiA4b ORF-3 family protein n=1 Tax=Mesobacillus jeotgali TaxID=129985 RepID=A0ABY9VKN6_9BACI|nr:plasmid pRiA4b ORF-3 family protein [Mesobacillus jeotgali]WNF23437.1 plasmid pRiA4b ORF-3 family protein [Mesobacillus jeotgali]
MNKQELLKDYLLNIRSLDSFKNLSPSVQKELDQQLRKIESMLPELDGEPERKTWKRIGRASKKTDTYQLKVSLKGARPPIWRRILVPANIKFHKLHEVIQAAMGWDNDHLYSFEIDNVLIEVPESEDEFGFFLPSFREKADSKKEQLNKWITGLKFKFTYTYDFGDNWEHTILVEKIEESPQKLEHPVCLTGKRACPPENCGGISKYQSLVTKDGQSHPECEEDFFKFNDDFDPEEFDLKEVNARLKTIRL